MLSPGGALPGRGLGEVTRPWNLQRLTLVLASPVGFTRPGADRGPASQGRLLPWGPHVMVLGCGVAVLAAHPGSAHLQKTVSAHLTVLHSP